MTEPQLLDTIQRYLPDVDRKKYRFIDNWWDNQIVILDNILVCRFPRNESAKAVHKKEYHLLNLISKHVTLQVPQYEFVAPDGSFVAYRIIRWDIMNVEIYQSLSSETQILIQKQLGNFLSELHSISLDELKEIGYERWWGSGDMSWWITEMHQNFTKAAKNFLKAEELAQIISYITELWNFEYPYKTLTHGDMQGKNIIIREDLSSLEWVIDFSDARIADPALDFDLLWEYGEAFVSGVFAQYTGHKNDDLLWRSLFYAKRRPVFGLIDAVDKQEWVEEILAELRRVFKLKSF